MKAVNLLPSEQRGATKAPAAAPSSKPGGSAFGAYVVLGVLAFAVVAMAAYVLTTNSVKDRQAELARVTQETEAVKAKAAALQGFADFKQLADQRVATVQGLADSRFDWDRTLADLSRALPTDVHLKSLSGTTGTQVQGGGNSLRGAIQAPALEMSGCTTSQSGVARLMSRLRNVRGVTRVALTKSDKDGSQTVAVAPTTADGGTPASLCPKGTPPAFELVVFFERAAVNANAAPNVGAGTASATQPNTTQPNASQPNAAQPNAAQPNGAAQTTTPNSGAQSAPNGSGVTTTPGQAAGATQGVSAP